MIEVESRVRSWGNSLGVTIPNETANQLGIQPGEKIRLLIAKDSKVLHETFGKLKFSKSTRQMMKETDGELYD